jgi:hypothetical protein
MRQASHERTTKCTPPPHTPWAVSGSTKLTWPSRSCPIRMYGHSAISWADRTQRLASTRMAVPAHDTQARPHFQQTTTKLSQAAAQRSRKVSKHHEALTLMARYFSSKSLNIYISEVKAAEMQPKSSGVWWDRRLPKGGFTIPCRSPAANLPWPWEVAFRTAWSWHGKGTAWHVWIKHGRTL